MTETLPGHADLTGRVAVVAGGTRGIGHAVARALAAAGAAVVVNGRSEAAVDTAVAEIRAAGGSVLGFAGSAGDEGVAAGLVAAARAEFGALDIAVNCAGIAEPPAATVLTITPAEFREQLDAHLMSAFHLTQAAGRVFVAQGSGSLVLTGSAAALGTFGGSGYPAAKGGVNALVLACASEFAAAGARINVVMPGARSRLSTGPDYEAHIERLHRSGVLDELTRDAALDPAPPEYVAALYVHLASDAARAINGRIFTAAGGFIGRYDAHRPALVAYRDHHDSPPYSAAELTGLLSGS